MYSAGGKFFLWTRLSNRVVEQTQQIQFGAVAGASLCVSGWLKSNFSHKKEYNNALANG